MFKCAFTLNHTTLSLLCLFVVNIVHLSMSNLPVAPWGPSIGKGHMYWCLYLSYLTLWRLTSSISSLACWETWERREDTPILLGGALLSIRLPRSARFPVIQACHITYKHASSNTSMLHHIQACFIKYKHASSQTSMLHHMQACFIMNKHAS